MKFVYITFFYLTFMSMRTSKVLTHPESSLADSLNKKKDHLNSSRISSLNIRNENFNDNMNKEQSKEKSTKSLKKSNTNEFNDSRSRIRNYDNESENGKRFSRTNNFQPHVPLKRNNNEHIKKYLIEKLEQDSKYIYPNILPQKYSFVKELGKGQFGVVNQVYNTKEQKLYAMKVYNTNKKRVNEEKIKVEVQIEGIQTDAIREIGILNKIKNQNHIISIKEVIEEVDVLKLVYQHADSSLDKIIKDLEKYQRRVNILNYLIGIFTTNTYWP